MFVLLLLLDDCNVILCNSLFNNDEAQISPLLKQYFLVKVYVFPLKLLFFSKYSDCGLQTGDKIQTKDCRPEVKCRLGSKTTRFPGPRKSWEAGNNCHCDWRFELHFLR